MLSLRALSRALPKASFRQPSIRCLSSLSRPTFQRSIWQPTTRISYPAFSTSAARKEPAGESDSELSAKIAEEYELELRQNDKTTHEQIEQYLQEGPFEIIDKPGTNEVTLTREFGNEKIKIEFSVNDMENEEDEYDQEDEDGAYEDEVDFEGGKNPINARGNKFNVAPEDSIAPVDRDGGEDNDASDQIPSPAYPVDLLITITKPGDQALQITAVAAEGAIEIGGLHFTDKASALEADSGKEAQENHSRYGGPPVGNLDPELQLLLERYLEERGINTEFAAFVPDYVEYKEQKEYVSWLANIKNFVDA